MTRRTTTVWSEKETELLRRPKQQGLPYEDLAEQIGRNVDACRAKWNRLKSERRAKNASNDTRVMMDLASPTHRICRDPQGTDSNSAGVSTGGIDSVQASRFFFAEDDEIEGKPWDDTASAHLEMVVRQNAGDVSAPEFWVGVARDHFPNYAPSTLCACYGESVLKKASRPLTSSWSVTDWSVDDAAFLMDCHVAGIPVEDLAAHFGCDAHSVRTKVISNLELRG